MASSDTISHGICPRCTDNLMFQDGVDLQRYLDSLPVPVVLVDKNGAVESVNMKALVMLDKDYIDIMGKAGGIVFECEFARLPEGCGKTIHCSGCTIRRSVNETFATGRPIIDRVAYLSRDTSHQLKLLISTEKIRNTVFLRIDEIDGKRCFTPPTRPRQSADARP